MVFQLHLGTDSVAHAHPQPPLCVESGTPVRSVLTQLQSERRGCCLVCRDGSLIGVFTERDIVRLMAGGSAAFLDQPVDQVMTPDPVTIAQSDSVAAAIASMSHGGFRQLPVVDQDHRPTGLLNVAGILHYLVEHFPQYVYNLPPEPHHATQEREGA